MPKKTIDQIVQKQLKRYKLEIAILWLIIGMGAVLIVTGAGVYFYVDKLSISQYLSTTPVHNFAVFQAKAEGYDFLFMCCSKKCAKELKSALEQDKRMISVGPLKG